MSEPLHIVCPHCHTTNRVQQRDLEHAPDCGKCKAPLFAGRPVALDEAQFERHLSKSSIPLLVDFWAPWCAPCRQMAPAFEQAARQLEPGLRLVKVDTEQVPALGTRFNVRSIPTLALFQGGREVARHSGAIGTAEIVRWARSHAG